MSALVPTSTMRSPRIATAPFSITRRCASIVTTYRALRMVSTASARRNSAKTKKLVKKRSIEGSREQVFQLECFGFAVEVNQGEFGIAAELPEDLAAGPAGRRQCVG